MKAIHPVIKSMNGIETKYNKNADGIKCLNLISDLTFFNTRGLNKPYWKYCFIKVPMLLLG